jgi:hypothetical protein
MILNLAEALSMTTAQILTADGWPRIKELLAEISGDQFNTNDRLDVARIWRDCRAWIASLHPDLDMGRNPVLTEAVTRLKERIAQLSGDGISGKTPGDSKDFVVEVWLSSLIPSLGNEFEVATPIPKIKKERSP